MTCRLAGPHPSADFGPRLLLHGISIAALVLIGWAWQFAVRFILDDGIARAAIDAHAYWSIDLQHLYAGAVVGQLNAFLYSPAAAQFLAPFGLLPWPVFYGIWIAGLLGSLIWLVGPVPAALLLFLPPVWQDITTGNVHLFLAVLVVVGFRLPAAWAGVVLTKVTPGIGIAWFAARKEWRKLALAAGATIIIAAASIALAPGLWSEWLAVLRTNASEPPRLFDLPLIWRLPPAILITVFGARRNWRWTLPVAATIALPVLWVNSLTLLLAAVPLISLPSWGQSLRRPFRFGAIVIDDAERGQDAPSGRTIDGIED